MKKEHITAILLAGGQGSRMNHLEKAWVEYEGKPLIQHVIDHIEADISTLVISRNRQLDEYDALGYLCVADELPDFQGPLAGLASCLIHLTTPTVLVLPCDVPKLPHGLVDRLMSGAKQTDICVAEAGGRIQPLIFMGKTTSVSRTVRRYLDTGRRSVMGWLETTHYQTIEFESDNELFENINETTQIR